MYTIPHFFIVKIKGKKDFPKSGEIALSQFGQIQAFKNEGDLMWKPWNPVDSTEILSSFLYTNCSITM